MSRKEQNEESSRKHERRKDKRKCNDNWKKKRKDPQRVRRKRPNLNLLKMEIPSKAKVDIPQIFQKDCRETQA